MSLNSLSSEMFDPGATREKSTESILREWDQWCILTLKDLNCWKKVEWKGLITRNKEFVGSMVLVLEGSVFRTWKLGLQGPFLQARFEAMDSF